MRRMLTGMLAAITLGGCASLAAAGDPYAPLKLAFGEPVDALRARADGGEDAQAAWAMHFLTLHGLRGVRRDAAEAERFRRASLPRQITITQYTAAFNGAPSRVNLIPVTVGGVRNGERLSACGQALLLPRATAEVLGPVHCGADGYAQLAPLARASSTPLP